MRLVKSLVLTLACIFTANTAYADGLSDFILKQLNAKEFLAELYIEEYQAFGVVEGEYTITTKKDLEEYYKVAGDQLLDTEITSLRIMSRADTEDFTSATFEYEWALKVGNTEMAGKVSGVGVFLKVDGGYISIFDAQTN